MRFASVLACIVLLTLVLAGPAGASPAPLADGAPPADQRSAGRQRSAGGPLAPGRHVPGRERAHQRRQARAGLHRHVRDDHGDRLGNPDPGRCLERPPTGRRLSANRVLAIAQALPKMRAVRAKYRAPTTAPT